MKVNEVQMNSQSQTLYKKSERRSHRWGTGHHFTMHSKAVLWICLNLCSIQSIKAMLPFSTYPRTLLKHHQEQIIRRTVKLDFGPSTPMSQRPNLNVAAFSPLFQRILRRNYDQQPSSLARLETSRKSSTARQMVLTTPEAIIEQASTQNLLDNLIDESVRTSARRPIMMQFDPGRGHVSVTFMTETNVFLLHPVK